MRLIDADELRRWLNGYLETDNISPTYIRALIDSQQTVEAIPIDKPFLKMKYKGYTAYKTEWLKEHIEMEYRVIKGISESKAEAIPIEWLENFINKLPRDNSTDGMSWTSLERWGIKMAISEWEKENGRADL